MKKEIYFLNVLVLPDEVYGAKLLYGYKTENGFYDSVNDAYYCNSYLKFLGCENNVSYINGITIRDTKNTKEQQVIYYNSLSITFKGEEKTFYGYKLEDGFYDIENEEYYSNYYLKDFNYEIKRCVGFITKKYGVLNNIKSYFKRK